MLNPFLKLANIGSGARFWIAQFAMVTATIGGVYLASFAGFELATKFERFSTTRNVYYMLSTLQEEVRDNLDEMEALAKDLKKGGNMKFMLRKHTVQTYIWVSMQQSPYIFHIPSEIITTTRRYYTALNVLTSQDFIRRIFLAKLNKLNTSTKNKLLQLMAKEKDRLQQELNSL